MTMAGRKGTSAGQVAGSRFIVRETSDGLGIVVPLARNKGLMFFLKVFLTYWVGFSLFDLFVLSGFLREYLLPGSWYALWLIAGAVGMGMLGWKLFGTERLFITGGALVFSKGLGFLSRRAVFLLDEVKKVGIRTIHVPTGYKGGMVLQSIISFEARGKTYNFGADMEAEERSAVYHAILRHLPPQPREDDEAS